MDEALVQDAQHEVDRHHGRQQQQALVGQRLLEHAGGTGEGGADRGGHAELALDRLDPLDRVAQRHALRQVERDGHRRQLAQLVDRQRPRDALDPRECRQRHDPAGGRGDPHIVQTVGAPGDARVELDDDGIAVAGGVDGRGLPAAEAGVEGRAELLGGDPERACLVPVDHDPRLQGGVLEVTGDVGEGLVAAHPVGEPRRPIVKLVAVDPLDHELVLALARPAAEAEILDRDDEAADAGDAAEVAAQVGHHLRAVGARSALGFSSTKNRPLLSVPAAPTLPMIEATWATCGERSSTASASCCSACMAGNEMSWRASVWIESWPMSSCGKKPLGMSRNSQTVTPTVAMNSTSISGRARRQRSRATP